MDILKNRQTKTYDYISRYSSFFFYYNTKDDKYIYGITNNLSEETPYLAHKVEQSDTLDKLSYKYYGRPDLYWVIADFNRIQDSFINLYEKLDIIKIPTLSSIQYKK